MKKKSIVLIVFALAFALCACGNAKAPAEDPRRNDDFQNPSVVSDEGQPSDPAPSPSPAPDPSLNHSSDADIARILTDADVRALAVKHIDMSGYDERLYNYYNVVDHRIDTATVDGVKLTIGMSYSEVVRAGFTATDESFSETKTGALAYLCNFYTPSGNEVTLGFCGKNDETVADGWLYSVSITYGAQKEASVFIENICGGSSIEDLLFVFGTPESIDQIKYDGRYMLRPSFRCDHCSLYIAATIDPITSTVVDLTLEGYPD